MLGRMQAQSISAERSGTLRLLRDTPSDLAGDQFAHRSYVDTLVQAVLGASRALTIGLFGPWGMGKSSVLTRLQSELEGKAAYVGFDAWRYDSDSLRRQLLRELVDQLADAHGIDENFDARARLREFDQDLQKTRLRPQIGWASLITALFRAVVTFAALWIALKIPAVENAFGTATEKGTVLPAVTAIVVLLVQLLGDLLRLVPEVTVRRRLEDPERFYDMFRELVRHLKSARLVIAIDNIDRCTPERALELLATVKTYLEPVTEEVPGAGAETGKNVVFVLAVDDQALRRHLMSRELERVSAGDDDDDSAAANARAYVDEYLRKIFAVTLRIAPFGAR
jgi:KAP family P-loop domain